jgi:hypothetical protein
LKDFEKQLELLWKMPGSGGECWSLKQEVERALAYYSSAQFFFEEFPSPIATTSTNADGTFTLTIPARRRIALGANTHSQQDQSEIVYYWLVDAGEQPRINFTNDNLASSGAKISLLHAVDAPVISSVVSDEAIGTRIKALWESLTPKPSPTPPRVHS